MKTENVNLDAINLDPHNLRKHGEKNLAAIRASLDRFGQHRAAVVQRSTGIVLIGNGMVQAAKDLGWKQVSVHYVDDDNATAAMRAYADNRTGELAEWMDGYEDVVGAFDDDFLADMDFDINAGEVVDVVEDEVPEAPVDPVTQPGDVIRLGRHVLVCGDSLEADSLALLPLPADACFTDPPYNVSMGTIKHEKFKSRAIENDSMPAADWAVFTRRFVDAIKANTKGCVYVCQGTGPDARQTFTLLDEALHWSATITWVKDQFVLGRGKYHRRSEHIWFGWVGDGKGFTAARDRDDVWEIPRPKASPEHPTMKPIGLVAQAIQDSTRPGQTVFDPFLGSGTTLLAAEQTGRVCLGIELDPAYCDVIVQRWEALTGETAERPERADA